MEYLRFWIATLAFIIGVAISFILGGVWMWYGVAFTVFIGMGVDLLLGKKANDISEPEYKHGWIFEVLMHVNVALSAITLAIFVWACSSVDLFGFGAWVQSNFDYNALVARSANTWIGYVGAAISLGMMLAIEIMAIGHELVSRTWDPISMFTGRWALALMFDTNFATEHVFGHHKNLGFSDKDPVSVQRGKNFYYFITVGTLNQWMNDWREELDRLHNKGKSPVSWKNQILRAWLRALAVIALIACGGGWRALEYYLLAITVARVMVESLNYFSHYGIVREAGRQIEVRHTFSDNSWISNLLMYNMGRHGHHHTEPVPFYRLMSYPEMPQTPFSYITMAIISLIPPLYFKVITPVLKEWDAKYATSAERALIADQNARSGLRGLADVPGERFANTSAMGPAK